MGNGHNGSIYHLVTTFRNVTMGMCTFEYIAISSELVHYIDQSQRAETVYYYVAERAARLKYLRPGKFYKNLQTTFM